MRNISSKNNSRYPVVEAGQVVKILDAKIPSLNGLEGIIVEAPRVERSPHKAIYKINIVGRAGPWYLFRTEFQPLSTQEAESGNAGKESRLDA